MHNYGSGSLGGVSLESVDSTSLSSVSREGTGRVRQLARPAAFKETSIDLVGVGMRACASSCVEALGSPKRGCCDMHPNHVWGG